MSSWNYRHDGKSLLCQVNVNALFRKKKIIPFENVIFQVNFHERGLRDARLSRYSFMIFSLVRISSGSSSNLWNIHFSTVLCVSGVTSARQIPLYNRHKVGPIPNPPTLSATSNIPNIGGLVQNMNDLSARTNIDAGSQNSSNYSGDPPDSLAPTWPAGSPSRRVKKLSWDDDDRVITLLTASC